LTTSKKYAIIKIVKEREETKMVIKLQRRYIVTTQRGSILCTSGEVYKPTFIGAGTGHSARIWRTKKYAEQTALRFEGFVREIDERGMEV
jgi:hypothetical protein